MTKYGGKIPDITIKQVREQLADEADPKAIKRLTAAREYLDGQSPGEIDAKFGWDEQTIYGWLNRFEERGFSDSGKLWRLSGKAISWLEVVAKRSSDISVRTISIGYSPKPTMKKSASG